MTPDRGGRNDRAVNIVVLVGLRNTAVGRAVIDGVGIGVDLRSGGEGRATRVSLIVGSVAGQGQAGSGRQCTRHIPDRAGWGNGLPGLVQGGWSRTGIEVDLDPERLAGIGATGVVYSDTDTAASSAGAVNNRVNVAVIFEDNRQINGTGRAQTKSRRPGRRANIG